MAEADPANGAIPFPGARVLSTPAPFQLTLPRCDTCLFWKRIDANASNLKAPAAGVCRRMPSQIVNFGPMFGANAKIAHDQNGQVVPNLQMVRPIHTADDFCGEHPAFKPARESRRQPEFKPLSPT